MPLLLSVCHPYSVFTVSPTQYDTLLFFAFNNLIPPQTSQPEVEARGVIYDCCEPVDECTCAVRFVYRYHYTQMQLSCESQTLTVKHRVLNNLQRNILLK